MATRVLTSAADFERYDAWLKAHPDASLWQSLEWKKFQEALGRKVKVYVEEEGDIRASALVVIDTTSLGLTTWEIPRGPMNNGQLTMDNKLLKKIIDDAKAEKALVLYLSPLNLLSIGHCQLSISSRHVFPSATRILDLTLSDEQLLAQMKPKGRYNIGLAQKHGVTVVQSHDVEAYAELAAETARRDRFRGHGEAFFRHFLKDLPGSFLLLAEHQKKPVAGLLGVVWGKDGIYYYGASGNAHRELMAPYLLQWEAMKHCRSKGCATYDLFGIAPVVGGAAERPLRPHPWAGVSEFKAKFGGSVVNYAPEQEITLRPVMKGLLKMKRQLIG